MLQRKIALCGQMGAGKDFAAQILLDDYGFARYAFGDYVKANAQMVFPEEFEGDAKPRRIMQMFGQSMRQIEPDIWVNKLFADIDYDREVRKAFGYVEGCYVITDVRQPNEFARLKEAGFTMVRITASFDTRLSRMKERGDNFDVSTMYHETEMHIADFPVDYEIDNDDISREELQIQLERILFNPYHGLTYDYRKDDK